MQQDQNTNALNTSFGYQINSLQDSSEIFLSPDDEKDTMDIFSSPFENGTSHLYGSPQNHVSMQVSNHLQDSAPNTRHYTPSTREDFSSDSSASHTETSLDTTSLSAAHQSTGLDQARADYGFYGAGQTAVVIDTGLAYDHAAFSGRYVGGWDFTEGDANPYDDRQSKGSSNGHGTHVTGIIGSADETNTGVAPEVDLVSLRVSDDYGNSYFSWVEQALQWTIDNLETFDNPITTVNISLSQSMNVSTAPSWAMLEDEFAQLEEAGVFISVSAGNSYQTYNTPGLGYPASSEYVVPVMSVNDDGENLSYFSQRHDRAIAAPGSTITSTVPDHTGDKDGTADDFKSMSGTSMSAPYVAGASVIIREAMEFVGQTGITQDVIYAHMRATADVISGGYLSLNLGAAIDALMPEDDYGSILVDAFDMGALIDGANISGVIAKISDLDFFSFTAAVTGTVTFLANTTHYLATTWDGIGVVSGALGEIFTMDVVQGENYTLGLGTSEGIGYYDLSVQVEELLAVNIAPEIDGESRITLGQYSSENVSNLVTAFDQDGDNLTYIISTEDAQNRTSVLNLDGDILQAGEEHILDAEQFSRLQVTSQHTEGTDVITVAVYDGTDISDTHNIDVTTRFSYDLQIGDNEDNTLTGDERASYLMGLGGNDLLDGNEGNDTLYGGQGADILYGGEGDDVLYGGAGQDVLYGGDGSDVFVFDNSSFQGDGLYWNYDIIKDFDLSEDRLDLSQILSFDDPLSNDIQDILKAFSYETKNSKGTYILINEPDDGSDALTLVAYLEDVSFLPSGNTEARAVWDWVDAQTLIDSGNLII